MHKQVKEFWFIVGSQDLYGEDVLAQVKNNGMKIADTFNHSLHINCKVHFKGVFTCERDITQTMQLANSTSECAGIILWMHNFSPGKMWIPGLRLNTKPLLHMHTQFVKEIPWETIDMEFLNLHQSAHGDREIAYTLTRLGIKRTTLFGDWEDTNFHRRIGKWMNTAVAVSESKRLRIARFGDNMRQVADTDGDKLEAQITFGWQVENFGIGDLVQVISDVTDEEVSALMEVYRELYTWQDESIYESVFEQARIEIALEKFLTKGNFQAFTTNFQELHGMRQLPGLAVQRMMAKGYGFGAEGDWKVAAMTYLLKVMSNNQSTSFIEEYAYNLNQQESFVFGTHMLEVCPTLSKSRPIILKRSLDIGQKEAPARLVFDTQCGRGVLVSVVDMGNHFRFIVNDIETIDSEHNAPSLPVARTLWKPYPSLQVATEGWLRAGGSHHSVISLEVDAEQIRDFTDHFKVDCIHIHERSSLPEIVHQLQLLEVKWGL